MPRHVHAEPVKRRLVGLFPSGVHVAVREVRHFAAPVRDSARPDGAAARPDRGAERAAGRASALEALSACGITLDALDALPDGAPAWPPGVVGSISHSAGLAAAAVSRCGAFPGIGLDLAETRPLSPDRAPLFATPSERRWLSSLPADERPIWTMLLFALKESLQKCARPLLGTLPQPHRIEVRAEAGDGRATARLEGAPRVRLAARFAVEGNHILAASTARLEG